MGRSIYITSVSVGAYFSASTIKIWISLKNAQIHWRDMIRITDFRETSDRRLDATENDLLQHLISDFYNFSKLKLFSKCVQFENVQNTPKYDAGDWHYAYTNSLDWQVWAFVVEWWKCHKWGYEEATVVVDGCVSHIPPSLFQVTICTR